MLAEDATTRARELAGSLAAGPYLTLSQVVPRRWQLLAFSQDSMTVNYGLNKVRFPAPTPWSAGLDSGKPPSGNCERPRRSPST